MRGERVHAQIKPCLVPVPQGACDCHVHVFGPFDRFPLSPQRSYTPDPALASDLLARMHEAGVERAVIVQPSAYGTDNRCTLDAVGAHPTRLRAVGVIDGSESDVTLDAMDIAGVRGVRLNIVSGGGPSADRLAMLLRQVAARIHRLGWHIQVFAPLATIVEHAELLESLPVDIVLDHMGKPVAAAGLRQPGFDTLLALLRSGKFWVKLSGPYRISPDLLGNADVVRAARALVAANPDRAVWGSDWPYIGEHARVAGDSPPPVAYRPIDYGQLLSLLPEWVGDADVVRKVLVDNPARLYRF